MTEPTYNVPFAAKQLAFKDVAVTLKRRIERMLALPLARPEPMAIQHEIKNIGTA